MTDITQELENKIRESINTKNELFAAIKAKGGSIANPELFSSYPQAVRDIKLADTYGFMTTKLQPRTFYEAPKDSDGMSVSFSHQLVVTE